MNQEDKNDIVVSIVKDRRKMFEQNDILVRSACSMNTLPMPKGNKDHKVVTTKSESNRANLGHSFNTADRPSQIMKPQPNEREVTKRRNNLDNLDCHNKNEQVEIDIRSETVSQSGNMESSISKKVQFCEGVVLPPVCPLPKSEEVNKVLNTANQSSGVYQKSMTTQRAVSSEKSGQIYSNQSSLIVLPPPPPPIKSAANQNTPIAQLPLVPLPPPSTEAEILKPNSPNRPNLLSETLQTIPVPLSSTKLSLKHSDFPPPPPSTESNLTHSDFLPPPPSTESNLTHSDFLPPPSSLISEKYNNEISSNSILSSTALAPPVPPPPSAKGIGIIPKDFFSNLPQKHPVAPQLLKTLENKILDTASFDNLTPPAPPPPPSIKIVKQSNNLIGWAITSSNEKKTSIKESDIPIPVENRNRKLVETNKGPPIVATPPSLESVRKIKENNQSAVVTHKENTSSVRNLRQQENSEDVYDDDEDIINQAWYFDVTKEEATDILKTSTRKGTYMMRPSQDNQYVLMVRIGSNETKKFKIQKYNDGWILGEPSNTKKTYLSILALMEHYKTNGIKFSNSNIVLKEPASKK